MNEIKYYIDLDTLFDTRYTILSQIYDIDILKYATRKTDNYDYIGSRPFGNIYSERDRKVLLLSDDTFMHDIFISSMLGHKEESILEGTYPEFELVINHYPYLLNDDEKKSIVNKFSSEDDIIYKTKLIYEEPGDWIIHDHKSICSYNGMLLLHRFMMTNDLYKDNKRDTLLLLPAIMEDSGGDISSDVYFSGLMDGCKLFIDIQFINISNYCSTNVVEKLNKNKGNTNGTETEKNT